MGYVYGSDEFKKKFAKLKDVFEYYYDQVNWYCIKNRITISNPNHLVLIGIWKNELVFRLRVPENKEYIVIKSETPPENCFLCNSETGEVQRIKKEKAAKDE